MTDILLKFETLLDEFHNEKFEFISDHVENNRRVVKLRKYTLFVNLIVTNIISFDLYSELNSGIYELGELHSLVRRMLNVKKICLSYDCREMNTTERLYPADRRGENTKTSGL